MNGLPDWVVLTLVGVVLLLSCGLGSWIGLRYLFERINNFILRYTKPD